MERLSLLKAQLVVSPVRRKIWVPKHIDGYQFERLQPLTLKDRVIVVTGASRGIGLSMALRAARDGAKIVIIAKTSEPHPKLPGTIYSAA